MILKRVHFEFWKARRHPVPKWAECFDQTTTAPSIHALINAHAGVALTRGEIQANNTITILRLACKRGALREVLARMAQDPGTRVEPLKREAFCRKWLRKINLATPCSPLTSKEQHHHAYANPRRDHHQNLRAQP